MTPLLELDSIQFGFSGQPMLFNGASLVLGAHESVGLYSGNGTGKTTLMRLITGLTPLQGGMIKLHGKPVMGEADFVALRQKVGLVLQNADDQLFFPDVFDDLVFGPKNLGFSDHDAEHMALEAMALLGASHLVDRESFCLSGGQKRLVSIGAILAMQPEALLLDEPTTGLDSKSEEHLKEVLSRWPGAKLIVSHELDFLKATCHRIVTIRDGLLVKWGDG